MAYVYPKAHFGEGLVPTADATLSITSAAVLYGLSVYTVLPVTISREGRAVAFRLSDHYRRLVNSARIIGIDTFDPLCSEERFVAAVKEVVLANEVAEDVFIRVSVHVDEQLPGTRSRGMHTSLSMFVYYVGVNNGDIAYAAAAGFLMLLIVVVFLSILAGIGRRYTRVSL